MSSESFQILMVILIAALYIPACFVIARKAGFSGWYSLLMLVPVLNLIFIYYFAFSTWPIERPNRLAKPAPDRLPNS
jgi:hypothetical protein